MWTLVCDSAWSGVTGGLLAGVVASAIVVAIGWLWRCVQNYLDFDRQLTGTYVATEKAPSDAVAGCVRVSRSGRLFLSRGWSFQFRWDMMDGSHAIGRIAMNEQSRVSGLASYEHIGVGWGYLDVQVGAPCDNEPVRLLVDGRYTDQKHRTATASGWIWERKS